MSNNRNTHALPGTGSAPRTRIDVWRYVSIGVLLLGCIPMIVPLLWMAVTSLKPGATAFDLPPTWMPKELHFENYSNVKSRESFRYDVPFLTRLVAVTPPRDASWRKGIAKLL
jgi:ABC-type glycerol-3-phosphate transport system permease component